MRVGHDLIVIGAGPAGMTAAIYAAQHGLNFRFIGKMTGGTAILAPKVNTYPGCAHLTGFELMQLFEKHLQDLNVKASDNETVERVSKENGVFSVKTDKGDYRALAVIVATGRRDKLAGLPGEKTWLGKGLSYCAVCDSPLFKGKTVAVIGGGRSGILAALFMLPLMKKIYLIERKPFLGGTQKTRQITRFQSIIEKAKNVEVLTNTRVLDILGSNLVKGLSLNVKNKKRIIVVDGVFIEVGYVPNTEFLKHLAKLNDKGEAVVDKNAHTNVRGLYAAGDCTDIIGKQIIISCGEGANALIQASAYIEEMKNKKRKKD